MHKKTGFQSKEIKILSAIWGGTIGLLLFILTFIPGFGFLGRIWEKTICHFVDVYFVKTSIISIHDYTSITILSGLILVVLGTIAGFVIGMIIPSRNKQK